MHFKLNQTILSLLVLCAFFIVLSTCQTTPTSLELGKIYNLSLSANNSIKYDITIPASWSVGQNLYITGYSPINDPEQEPILKIVSNIYTSTCEQQSSNLNQVCYVPSSALSAGQKITVQALCPISCQARLVAYLSKNVQLDLNEKVQLTTQDSPVQKLFKVVIPANFNFTEINVILHTNTMGDEGVSMFIKCSANQQIPSKTNHDSIRLMNWGKVQAGIIRKGIQIKDNESIYVMISMGKNLQVSFQSRAISNNTRYLSLNQMYYDYLVPLFSPRVYELDVSDLAPSSIDHALLLEIIQFSGSPKIEVSLNKQFTNEKLVQPLPTSSWLRFQIQPELLKATDFQKIIYIKISNTWSSTYAILARFKISAFDSVFEGLSEYVEVAPNSVEKLIYKANQVTNNDTKTVQVQIVNQGTVDEKFKAYLCQEQNSYNCKDSQKVKQLTVFPKIDSYLVIYSVSDCVTNKGQLGQGAVGYSLCTIVFHISAEDSSKTGKYAVTVLQPESLKILGEGQSYTDSVQHQKYSYYLLDLPQGPQQNVYDEVVFFVNTLGGSVQIFASSEVQKPKLTDASNPKVKSGTNMIQFKANLGTLQSRYYLSVYGNQYSQYVISTIVRHRLTFSDTRPQIRINNDDKFQPVVSSSQIQLLQSIAQTYQLPKNTQRLNFKFKLFGNGNVTLVIAELVGSVVTYYVADSDHKRILCLDNYCQFEGKAGVGYFVEVFGRIDAVQKFSIVYKQNKQCYTYGIGTPVYVSLDPKDRQCLQYSILPKYPYELSNSLTSIQLLDHVAEVVIQFIDTNYTFVMSTNSYLFQSSDLRKYCPQTSVNSVDLPCNIRVKFISYDRAANIQFVMQKLDGIITLYDGVTQRVNTVINEKDNGKYFRYPVDKDQSIEIFLSSQSNTDYIISAQVVEGRQSTSFNNYPKPTGGDNVWRVSSSSDSPALTLLPISKLRLQNQIKSKSFNFPWLVISVFGRGNDSQHAIFSIEVTQSQRQLREGEQHVGFLQPNQIIAYDVYPSPLSMLSIRSIYSNKCFRLLDQNKKQVADDLYIEAPRTIPLKYYVQADSVNNCMYQIALQDYENSILSVTQGFPIKVISQFRETVYFIYYHNKNETFRVYQFIQSGFSSVYATPLNISNNTKGVKAIIEDISLNRLKYRSDTINNLEVQASDKPESQYCFNCYYLIAVKGNPSVHQQMVVVKDSTPVTIKQHSVVDSYLDTGENQTFIYYSGIMSKFNLSIDVVYGKVTVTVSKQVKGQYKVQKVQTVQRNMVNLPIVENPPTFGLDSPTDSLNVQQKYRILVTASQNSLYHLQVLKYSDAFRIAQGIASKFSIPSKGAVNLQYDNILSQGDININIESQYLSSANLPIIVSFYRQDQRPNQAKIIQSTSTRVGRVMVLNFKSMRGHYNVQLLNVDSIGAIDIYILMPKPGLTELREQRTVIASSQNIFEIYIDDGYYAVIEVFDCEGNMRVRGSAEIQEVQRGTPGSREISLLHQNVGGHFIVTTPANLTGQYFIRVQNKEYTAGMSDKAGGITYMIRYMLFPTAQKNPYLSLDAKSYLVTVRSTPGKQNITVTTNRIYSQDPEIKIKSVRYLFAIGKSADDVQNYMVCATTKDTKHLAIAIEGDEKSKTQTVQIQFNKLDIIKKVGQKTDAFVGVIALVQIQLPNKEVYDDFAFVYPPAFLGQLQQGEVLTVGGFFEIMVIVFTVISGAVIIFALGLYFLKRWRGYVDTNELVQQQSGPNVVSSQFEISNAKRAQQQDQEKASQQHGEQSFEK